MPVLPFPLPNQKLIHSFGRAFYNYQTMKGSFHNPSFTYWSKAFYLITTDNYFKNVSKSIFNLLSYFSTISGICQYDFDIATEFPQTPCQQISCLAIMHTGNRHHDCKQEAIFIYHHMTFNAFYFFVPVNTIKRTIITPTYTLTIHDTQTSFCFFAPFFTRTFSRKLFNNKSNSPQEDHLR